MGAANGRNLQEVHKIGMNQIQDGLTAGHNPTKWSEVRRKSEELRTFLLGSAGCVLLSGYLN